MKEISIFEYEECACDDVGVLFTVRYTCPYCEAPTFYSSLKKYGTDVLPNLVTECVSCGEKSRIVV